MLHAYLLMNTTSINTPKAYEIIEHDGRHGIVSDKITGVELLSEFLKNPTDENLATEIIEKLTSSLMGIISVMVMVNLKCHGCIFTDRKSKKLWNKPKMMTTGENNWQKYF